MTETPTMQGLMFVEKGQAAFVAEPRPVCAPDTVLLQTLYSGLTNGTERNVLMGGNYGGRWPGRCAYQLVSRVIEVGAEITRFTVGDIVYTGTFPGHVPFHLARESDLIIKLPDGFDLQAAALLGVASVPMHDIRRAQTTIDDNVLVFGAGLVGQLAAQAARAVGAKVTIVDLDADRLALAKLLGADAALNISTEEGKARLNMLKPFTVVVEASGADVLGAILDGKDRLIAYRGRLLLIAGRFDVTYRFNSGQFSEVAVLHAGHFDQIDLEHVVRLVAKGTLRIRPLITNVLPIADAIRIYDTLRDAPNSLLGTVFAWESCSE